jgi:hypothetical protein
MKYIKNMFASNYGREDFFFKYVFGFRKALQMASESNIYYIFPIGLMLFFTLGRSQTPVVMQVTWSSTWMSDQQNVLSISLCE